MFGSHGQFSPYAFPTQVLADLRDIQDGDTVAWSDAEGRFKATPGGLVPTGVVPGSYTYMSANVDQYGRITSALDGVTPLITVAHDATLGGDGTLASPLTVIPGAITPTTVHTDNVTLEGDGGLATPVKLKQVQSTSNFTGDGTVALPLELADTTATPGSYTNSNVTVDSKGRITAISNGAGGGISSVSVVTGDLIGDGTPGNPIGLANYGTSNFWYSPKVTTDTKGRSIYTGPIGFGQGTSGELDCMMYNAGQNISNNTVTDVNYTSGTGSFPTLQPTVNNVSTTTGRFTMLSGQGAGMYIMTATISWTPNATGFRQVQIAVNGLLNPGWQVVAENTNFNVGGSFRTSVSATYVGYLDYNASVVVRAYQNSGGTLSCLSYFTVAYLHN